MNLTKRIEVEDLIGQTEFTLEAFAGAEGERFVLVAFLGQGQLIKSDALNSLMQFSVEGSFLERLCSIFIIDFVWLILRTSPLSHLIKFRNQLCDYLLKTQKTVIKWTNRVWKSTSKTRPTGRFCVLAAFLILGVVASAYLCVTLKKGTLLWVTDSSRQLNKDRQEDTPAEKQDKNTSLKDIKSTSSQETTQI
ncbi:hypothetical protein GWI33_020894 [Rhynchophorus ferrugineus]|uniref:Uncharacterized protein n=1 Tax=Rhynchophorus ferrugineus TaxID=354439 RepID=A0A834HQ23_RHYFE|nr:hypothetical protein GWI33_020894 [Rhynchophorus ferrugineus]